MNRAETRLAIGAAGAWIVGAILAIPIARADGPIAGDIRLAELVQASPDWLEPIARAFRALTTTEAVLIAGVALAVILFAARLRTAAAIFALGLLLLPLAQSGIKDIVDRPRPDVSEIEVRDDWTSPSFPSGHVMSGTFLYTFFALSPGVRRRLQPRLRKGVTIAAVAIIAGNAVANVFMGVHWPTDVLAGLLFGGGLAMGVVALERVIGRLWVRPTA